MHPRGGTTGLHAKIEDQHQACHTAARQANDSHQPRKSKFQVQLVGDLAGDLLALRPGVGIAGDGFNGFRSFRLGGKESDVASVPRLSEGGAIVGVGNSWEIRRIYIEETAIDQRPRREEIAPQGPKEEEKPVEGENVGTEGEKRKDLEGYTSAAMTITTSHI